MPLTTDRSSSDQARVFVLSKSNRPKAEIRYAEDSQEHEFWGSIDRHIFESSVRVILPGSSLLEARELSALIHYNLVLLINDRITARRGRTYLKKLAPKALEDLSTHAGIESNAVVKLVDDVFELRTKKVGACSPEDMFVTLKEAAYKGRVLRFLYPDEKTGELYVRRVKVKRVNTDNFSNVWFDAVSYVKYSSKSRLSRKDNRFRRYRLLRASEMLVEETPVRKLQTPFVVISSITKDKITTSLQSYDALASVATY